MIQDRKNELLVISSLHQSPSVQLSSISQASQSQTLFSSISIIFIIFAFSAAVSYTRQYESQSSNRQNHYSNIRNNQYVIESEYEDHRDSNRYETRNVDVQRNRNENRSRTRNLSNS